MPQCSECREVFNKQQGLRVHISRAHPALSQLMKQMNAQNKKKKTRPSRSASQPLPPPPLPPDPPDTAASQPQQQHQSQPSTSTTVTCSVCNRGFGNANGLRSHMSIHTVQSNNIRRDQLNALAPGSQPVPDSPPPTAASPTLRSECRDWFDKFDRIHGSINNIDVFDDHWFDETVSGFLKFLFEANSRLPGPVHPNVKGYRGRKNRLNVDPKYARTSNPQRVATKIRERRREQYQVKLAQHLYRNQRGKIARKVMNPKGSQEPCPVPITDLESHFRSVFETTNDRTLGDYPVREPRENISVTEEEVNRAIKSIKFDTSAGCDRVLARTIKDLKIGPTIKKIIDIMLETGSVPSGLAEGRTILLPKDGDPNEIGNWRPITIYSVVRRVIEKVLDKQLRNQIDIDMNQRGFKANIPGCHVNAKLVNACLLKAKEEGSDCTAVFLDLSKAFDRIGHSHIECSLKSQGVSPNLSRLAMALLTNNRIRIDTGNQRSEPIQILRSVPQGGPMSPTLFNLAIDFVYQDVCESQFANQNGFKLADDLDALCLSGFADDQVATSSTTEGAQRIVELTQEMFQLIGLEVNPRKSAAIHIEKGKIKKGELLLRGGDSITCIDENTTIRYLGCSFTSELVFDYKIIDKITDALNNILVSPLLKKDQKLNVINQYLLPMLIYPLQAAPINKIPNVVLTKLDTSIRRTVKDIVGLPLHSTPTNMIYSPRKFRGLGVMCCEWEVFLQHFSIAKRLSTVPDQLLHHIYDSAADMAECKLVLRVEGETARQLRTKLREMAFDSWASMGFSAEGVKHYKTVPRANNFVSDKNTLSCSEWTGAIKLSINYANLNGVPQNEKQVPSPHCRRCRRDETQPNKIIREVPSHVLGNCPFNDERRNDRHNRVKRTILKLLREKGYHCIEEAYCVDDQGSNRFIDILAFDPKDNKAYIIDPTVRFETNDDVEAEVQRDKSKTYVPCIPDLAQKYSQFGKRDFEVIGLWFGARGSLSRQVMDFFERFQLDKDKLFEIAERVLIDSIKMIHHHIYD